MVAMHLFCSYQGGKARYSSLVLTEEDYFRKLCIVRLVGQEKIILCSKSFFLMFKPFRPNFEAILLSVQGVSKQLFDV